MLISIPIEFEASEALARRSFAGGAAPEIAIAVLIVMMPERQRLSATMRTDLLSSRNPPRLWHGSPSKTVAHA